MAPHFRLRMGVPGGIATVHHTLRERTRNENHRTDILRSMSSCDYRQGWRNLVPREARITLLAIGYMTSLTGAFAAPPENSDPSLAPWFNSLSAPDGTACCALADCRRTMSRLTSDGYEVLIDDTWVTVPGDRVLP